MGVTSFLGRSYPRKKDLEELQLHVGPSNSIAFVSILPLCFMIHQLNPQIDSSLGISIIRNAQRSPPSIHQDLDTRPWRKGLNTSISTPIGRTHSAEVIVETYTRDNGTFFAIGCDAAAFPSIRTLGLSKRSRVFLLPVWRAIWRATELWAVKLQLQGS